MRNKIAVVVPNWNGKDSLGACLDSLLQQSIDTAIYVVENGSTDGSLDYIRKNYPSVEIIVNSKNLGFAGGVNSGIREAMQDDMEYVALFNNDAVADKHWLREMHKTITQKPEVGIVTCKLLSADKKTIDSTGDYYTTWGLPYPRGRDEPSSNVYDDDVYVFGASGGASLYRVGLLKEIGLFDEDFFAYYEDVDLSFRAQLAGWKVLYEPKSLAYHQHGTTSSKVKGFTTYQTFKNFPLLLWKNVPASLLPIVLPRFIIAYGSILISSTLKGRGWWVLRGVLASLLLLPKKLFERRKIQTKRKVSPQYIYSIMTHDLPPNAAKLRKLRSLFIGP